MRTLKTTVGLVAAFLAGIVLVVTTGACLPNDDPSNLPGYTRPCVGEELMAEDGSCVGPDFYKDAPTETWDERVASLNCEDWQIPGWLGDDGLPTSCVNNEAVPGANKGEPPATPAPTEEATKPEQDGCGS